MNHNDEDLETLDEETVEEKQNYDQQVNELLNSVTMANLVSPEKKKKSKKGLVIGFVAVICVISAGAIVFLSNGTFSKILPATTSELDVFKDETTSREVLSSKDVGKFMRVGNSYTLDTSNAENGITVKYYINTLTTIYITYDTDYGINSKFTINVNNANYKIEQDEMGTLVFDIDQEYIVFSNSVNNDQIILSRNGLPLDQDDTIDQNKIIVTTTTTTTPKIKKEFNFENTADSYGRTTFVITEYDETDTDIDYIYIDEDGVAHIIYYGSEESMRVHPELYTTTQAN